MVIVSVEVEKPFLQVLLRRPRSRVRLRLLPSVANRAIVTMSFPLFHTQPTELKIAGSAENTAIEGVLDTIVI